MATLSELVRETEVDVTAVFQGYNATEKQFVWTVRVQLPGNPNHMNSPFSCGLAHCTQIKGQVFGRMDPKNPRVKIDREIAKALKHGGSVTLSDMEGFVTPTKPTAETVVSCLVSDAQAGDETFENFCSNFGYDVDSRKAEKVWLACVNTRATLRKVLGAHYEAFMQAENDV